MAPSRTASRNLDQVAIWIAKIDAGAYITTDIDRDHVLIRSGPLPKRMEFSEATGAPECALFRGREFEKPSGAGRRPGGCHQRGASSDLADPLFRRLSAPAY